jgi:3-dehydrosphinganine reductase
MIYVNPMAGFSSYGPSKAAVRHLADCLRNELQGTGVSVSVGYPPDTQTPGFDVESVTKPGVTKAICQVFQEDVYTAEKVAKVMYAGLLRGDYHLPNPDLLHMFGLSLVAGLTPRPRWAILEVLMAPVLVIVGIISYMMQDRIVRKFWTSKRAPVGDDCKTRKD